MLLVGPIVAGLLGFVVVQRIPSVYEADETVSVQPTTGADGVPDVQSAPGVGRLVRGADPRVADFDRRGGHCRSGVHAGACQLSSMVQARRLTNTSLVRLSVQATDPTLAAQFANAIVTTFISQNSQGDVARYTATQNNLVGLVTQLQNDQTTRRISKSTQLRVEAASADRDAQIARLQDQVTQLQASQAVASRSLQDLQLASARSGTRSR